MVRPPPLRGRIRRPNIPQIDARGWAWALGGSKVAPVAPKSAFGIQLLRNQWYECRRVLRPSKIVRRDGSKQFLKESSVFFTAVSGVGNEIAFSLLPRKSDPELIIFLIRPTFRFIKYVSNISNESCVFWRTLSGVSNEMCVSLLHWKSPSQN